MSAATVGERLQRVVYAKALVFHLVHLAHAAAPDAADDFVWPDRLPFREHRLIVHFFHRLS